MRNRTYWTPVALACCLALALTGCQTYAGSAATGAVAGGVIGGIIGNQSGNAAEGAAIGAVIGGVGGLIVKDIKVRRQRNKAETETQYEGVYNDTEGEFLQLEDTAVLPSRVQQGNMADTSITYALLGTPPEGVQVRESRTLRQGDRVLNEISTKSFTRTDGTWVSSQEFRVPQNLAPGEYAIATNVVTPQSQISALEPFTVVAN